MAYCKVRQAEMYYEDLEEGKPILMIHGYSPDHRLMSGCMEPIFAKRKGCRRIYLDNKLVLYNKLIAGEISIDVTNPNQKQLKRQSQCIEND